MPMKPSRDISSFTHGATTATIVPNIAAYNDEEKGNVENGSVPPSVSDADRIFLDKYRALDNAGQVEQS